MERMKKLLFTGMLLAGPVYSGFSQLYVGLGTGYGFGLATVNFTDDAVINQGGSYTYTSNKTSFGQGIPITLNVGYKVKEYASFELGLSYLLGSKETFNYEYYGTGGSETTTNELKVRMLRIVPALRFNFGDGKMLPYVRFGLVVGVMGKMTDAYHSVDTFGGATTIDEESEFTGGISMGINSALGFNYGLSDKLSFFAEINCFTQSWSPKRAEITKSTYNGIDQLPFMTTYQKETEFVKEDTGNVTAPINQGAPSTSTQIHFPLSSIGLSVGISFSL